MIARLFLLVLITAMLFYGFVFCTRRRERRQAYRYGARGFLALGVGAAVVSLLVLIEMFSH